MVFIQPQLGGNGLCHRLRVAGQHDRLADTGLFQALDGSGTVGFDHISDEQITCVSALHGNMDDGTRLGDLGNCQAQLCHQAGVAGGDGFAVHLCGHAVAAQLLHIGHTAGVNVLAVSVLDAQGDGVLGPALGQSGSFHKGIPGHAVFGVDAHHLEGALGQGAGLIKHHDAGAGQLLQIGGALDQDAAGRRTADAAEEAQRDGDDQSAGAADDQEGQGAVDPVTEAGGLAHQQQNDGGNKGQRQCAVADGGGVDPGKAGDEVLGAGLLHAGIFHEVEDLGNGGFAELLGGPDLQQAGHVHTAADDLIAGTNIPGQALAGQGGSVQGRSSLHDDAINGHPLAGLDHDHGAHLHIIGVHLLQPAVLVLHVGVIGANIHQAGNALAALAHGHALEQLADLVEDDNGTALHIIAQRKRAHGGNSHQEALVKGLAVLDAQQRLAEHIPADHQIGDAVEQKLHRRGELGQQFEDEHQHQRSNDPVQVLLLLFIHICTLLFSGFWAAMRRGGRGGFNRFSPRDRLFHVFP